MKEDEKKLEELKKKLKNRKKELRTLEDKDGDMHDKVLKASGRALGIHFKKSRGYGLCDLLPDVTAGDTIFLEECSSEEFFSVDAYLIHDDLSVHFGRIPPGNDVNSLVHQKNYGPLKFIREELESMEGHSHGHSLNHRCWNISGQELLVFKHLVLESELEKVYSMQGWKGIERAVGMLKKMIENPHLIDLLEDQIFSFGHRRDHRIRVLRDEIMAYASENELTPKEAVVALKIKNSDFARRFEDEKDHWKKKLKLIEDVFMPYIGR